MSTTMILRGNNIDLSRTTLLAMGVTDNTIKAFTTRKIAATLLAPPYSEELEAKGYNKLAEARTYAPLSFIGLVVSLETVKKNPHKAQGVVAALYRTMIYIAQPGKPQRSDSIHRPLSQYRFAARRKSVQRRRCSPTARTAPSRAKLVEREIEIYRETLKIAKQFTPDDLEDMSLLRKVQEGVATPGR